MLRVPYVRQKTDTMCGPAALQMVLQYYGVRVSQGHLAKLCRTTKVGTMRRNLVRAARSFGLSARAHTGSSVQEVRELLRQKIPVIVNYREPGDEEGHYAPVIGVQNQRIYFQDPYHGPKFSLPLKEFQRRWRGKHHTKNRRWILAISKQPEGDLTKSKLP